MSSYRSCCLSYWRCLWSCRCSHRSEKGCAVRAALAEGRLSQTRYDSYCAMYEEVKDVKDWQRPKV